MPNYNYAASNINDEFDTSGTFKGLTFQDYLDVIPKPLQYGSRQKGHQHWYHCFNPDHPDVKAPSLVIQPGDTQTCIWKCFGANECPQNIFTKLFNTWLIQAGKINIQKLPTKTLEGLAYQGVIRREEYFSIRDRRNQRRALNPVSMVLDHRNFDPKLLQRLEADGTNHHPHPQPERNTGSFLQFAKDRGFYG